MLIFRQMQRKNHIIYHTNDVHFDDNKIVADIFPCR